MSTDSKAVADAVEALRLALDATRTSTHRAGGNSLIVWLPANVVEGLIDAADRLAALIEAPVDGGRPGTDGLTTLDRAVLMTAGRTFLTEGEQANAVRSLGLTHIGYVQRLNALIDTEAALAVAPSLVNRLRRLRAERVGLRAEL